MLGGVCVCVGGGGGGGGGGADDKFVILLVKRPVVSQSASGLVQYGWLHADTRPYPFFTSRITNIVPPLLRQRKAT